MLIEICAASFLSAKNANKAGAHRIELCSELAVGGITPSHGLIQLVKEKLSIETCVLIRPRSGDFTYSEDEFETMLLDIEFCKKVGCEGIVSGILTKDNTIDIVRTKALQEAVYPMSFTFHRAFDWVQNPEEGLQQLIDCKVDRILTSGQCSKAIDGLKDLIKWKNISKGKLSILPGGGINLENISTFKEAGFNQAHMSVSFFEKTIDTPEISMNSSKFFDETKISYSNLEEIKKVVNLTS